MEEFFPSVSLGDPTLDMLLGQFGLQVGRRQPAWGGRQGWAQALLHTPPPDPLQDKSPPRARSSSSTLAQALRWMRKQLSPLEAPALLWGLLGTVVAIRVMQALLGPQSSPRAKEEKHRPAPPEDSVAASKQASPAPDVSSGSQTPRRKK